MGGYLSSYWYESVGLVASAVLPEAVTETLPPALAEVYALRSLAIFRGLPYPLEATRLIIQRDDGRLVLGWVKAIGGSNGAGYWSLVGGISKSIAPGEDSLSDFRPPVDARYARAGRQLPPAEQAAVHAESPLRGLRRETREEVAGDVDGSIGWLLDRVTQGRWGATVAKRSSKGYVDYKTHVCLAGITLTQAEIELLNAEISGITNREHLWFAAFPWEKQNGKIVVNTGGESMRGYDRDIVFGVFAAAVSSVMQP